MIALPFLLPVLVDTVPWNPDQDLIRVHELGVVVFDEGAIEAAGAPDYALLEELYPPVEVTAPILWFHGASFSGDFIVETPGGRVTVAYPQPTRQLPGDLVESAPLPPGDPIRAVVWEDISVAPVGQFDSLSQSPCPDELPFGWAVPYWRSVPANDVAAGDESWRERFLYYESTAGHYFHGLMEEAGADSFDIQDYYKGAGMVLMRGAGGIVAATVDLDPEGPVVTILPGAVYSAATMLEVFCVWGEGSLKSEELSALWTSWEGLLLESLWSEGGCWLLFPLPEEMVEGFSNLRLEPDQSWLTVEYNRLLLGLVRLEKCP
jgi:hypothetical protein